MHNNDLEKLSTRARRILESSGISTKEDARDSLKKGFAIFRIQGCGPKTFAEISEWSELHKRRVVYINKLSICSFGFEKNPH